MAQTLTTLASAATITDTRLNVTANTGATVGGWMKVDDEFMHIVAISSTLIDVRGRGSMGTVAVAHNILAPVAFGVASDFPEPVTGRGRGLTFANRDVVSYGATGAITLPVRDTVVLITKATAAAMTLADPSGVPDGVFLHIVSTTAAAHTVTLTTGYLGSSASDVFTFVNTVGHSKTLMAYKGKWADLGTSLTAAEAAGVAVA